jgi:hypothetical protein
MRTKILAAFLAGGLLVGAGFLTSMVSTPATAQAHEESEDSVERCLPRAFGLLEEVLAGLVDDETLTEHQAEAVTAAVKAKAEELAREHRSLIERLRGRHAEKWRPFSRGFRMGSLLDDGGIDQEEYEGLPEDHPLRQLDLDEYLADGLITPEELRQILRELWELGRQDT